MYKDLKIVPRTHVNLECRFLGAIHLSFWDSLFLLTETHWFNQAGCLVNPIDLPGGLQRRYCDSGHWWSHPTGWVPAVGSFCLPLAWGFRKGFGKVKGIRKKAATSWQSAWCWLFVSMTSLRNWDIFSWRSASDYQKAKTSGLGVHPRGPVGSNSWPQ